MMYAIYSRRRLRKNNNNPGSVMGHKFNNLLILFANSNFIYLISTVLFVCKFL